MYFEYQMSIISLVNSTSNTQSMYSKTATGKNSRGTPSVESFRGRLRIRFRANGQQKAFALGLADTSENRLRGETIARQMTLDLLSDNFDSTLNKYKPQSFLTVIETIKPKTELDLLTLWGKYTEFRAHQVEATTLAINYSRVENHLKKLPTKNLEDAILIRDFLVSSSSPYTTKRILTQINAACNWGLKSKLITTNPFYGLAQEINLTKNSADSLDIDPFSKQEREVIIHAFQSHSVYKSYASFVQFLFLTGCRTSEAIALKWSHINHDCSRITFSEALVNVSGVKIRKGLKNQDKRLFPCNQQLQALLLSIKPEFVNDDRPVFTSVKGNEINIHTFHCVWHGTKNHDKYYVGVLEKLAKEGKIERYRPPYQTRHTFITLCIDAGIDAKDVARWVGNSPEVIYRHYAGNKRDLQVPEI